MRTVGIALVTAASALALAGCGSSGGNSTSSSASSDRAPVVHASGSGDAQSITIKGNSMFRFQPMHIAAHTGTLTVTLVDVGSYPHNIDFTTLGAKSQTVTGDSGSTATTLTLQLAKPGRYPFICTYHSSAGMKGVLTVST
jgi:plastocyanin